MSEGQVGISGHELLKRVFEDLKTRLNGREIKLPSKVMVEIADDSDWHRSRTGYMGYESVVILNVGGKTWAIAFGTACGDYPADKYDCDIAAVKISGNESSLKKLAEEICESLQRNEYFLSSFIHFTTDGNPGDNRKGIFYKVVHNALVSRIGQFVVQCAKHEPGLFTMDMQPVVREPFLFKEECTAFLSEVFQKAMVETP